MTPFFSCAKERSDEGVKLEEIVMCKMTYDEFWKEVERLCPKPPKSEREMALEDLISHMWVHSGYENCGYRKMTAGQKALYAQLIKNRISDDT